jgi:hypothetical protein
MRDGGKGIVNSYKYEREDEVQQLIYMHIFYDGMSPSSKQIWCFGCNSMQSVCLHKGCPEHCDMCNRIKEIRLNRSTHPDLSI